MQNGNNYRVWQSSSEYSLCSYGKLSSNFGKHIAILQLYHQMSFSFPRFIVSLSPSAEILFDVSCFTIMLCICLHQMYKLDTVPRTRCAGGVVVIKHNIQKWDVFQKSPFDQDIVDLSIEAGTKIWILRQVRHHNGKWACKRISCISFSSLTRPLKKEANHLPCSSSVCHYTGAHVKTYVSSLQAILHEGCFVSWWEWELLDIKDCSVLRNNDYFL